MTVNLTPHTGCRIYNDWHEYLSEDEPSAVLDLSGFACMEEYLAKALNATARNRYNYSYKNGYTSRIITWEERTAFLDDLHAINTSARERQGKPMSDGYLKYPAVYSTPKPECPAHYARFIGCFKDGKLVAYITAHFCGKLAAASQILGHYEHLKNGIMLSVWMEFVGHCFNRGIEKIVYSRWKDGNDGLKYWKHSVGMKSKILKEQL